MKRSAVLASSAIVIAAVGLTTPPAFAGGHGPHAGPPRTVATDLVTPLSLEIGHHGTAYVSQNFTGELLKITRDGTKTTIASTGGDELGAVSKRGDTIYYATTGQDPEHPSANLWALRKGHAPKEIGDLYEHENTKNPDRIRTYGFKGLPQSCASQLPDEVGPATYQGLVDSHPYASLPTRRGVYVADAAANAILWVRHGKVHTVAVMPTAKPVRITADNYEAIGLPECTVGYKYRFEFVPTDVEMGRDGWLYVTSLPGGPEDASLGARGSVHRVNPHNGRTELVAAGFVGATNLAIGPKGQIAVAELFGGSDGTGQVTLLKRGSHHRSYLPLTSPAAVEWVGDRHSSSLYVTTDAFVLGDMGPQPIGKLVKVRLR
ncbi:ScyD/ScyE family protein [Aeromicrobium sp. 9AM]|uniref:ScyD/ScyE family protein n=1 Tax=Aeromicrobium sp. 9AM TaxID=2653126 RepID=UPI0012F346F2|nr:ScyD/ScyE family protein [Aeromicrobium sp. 9AM]VXC46495.1 ScyD/ScyE family protein [Aeromicrobium sp. 9AM]